MIKPETIGCLDVAKLNSVLTSVSDITNYYFMKDDNGTAYLIMNEINGHDCYVEDAIISAGSFLNGYEIASLAGLRLIVDLKHISDTEVAVGDKLIVGRRGKIEKGDPVVGEPYFVVEENVYLTMAAVKVRVFVKAATTTD